MYSELNGTKFESYTTVQGDRWDSISTKAYGISTQMDAIIQSNQSLPIYTIFPAGIKIKVPVIEAQPDNSDQDLLPPWKRTQTPTQTAAVASVPIFTNPASSGSFDGSYD